MSDYSTPDADTREELLAERKADRRYRAAFAAHPDPRDPDHPELPGDDEVTA